MKKTRFYIVLIGLIIVFTSCNPVLYQPHTPNIPTVSNNKPSELKVIGGLRNFDVHYNRLDSASGTVYQGMISLCGASPYSSQNRNSIRLGTGFAKYRSKGSRIRFSGLQLAFSTFNKAYFDAYDLGYIFNGGFDNKVHIQGPQLHLGTMVSQQFIYSKFSFNLSAMLDVNYAPRLLQDTYHFDPMVNYRDTSHFESRHLIYGVVNLQAQLHFNRYVQISAGTKVPLSFEANFRSPTYYTTEYVYFRLGLWLNWKPIGH